MKYLKAVEVPNGTHKTKKFHIESLALSGPEGWQSSPAILGVVKWHPGWRAFAFFPQDETLYEPQCLRDLADFCETETLKRKTARVKEREEEQA